jgi:hypothetical protein
MPTTPLNEFIAVGENWTITKNVGERKDYGVNAAARLAAGDSITAGGLQAVGVGVTVDGAAFLDSGTFVMAWIMGGSLAPGADNYVDLKWTTTAGRIETQRIYFKVKP